MEMDKLIRPNEDTVCELIRLNGDGWHWLD